MFNIVEYYLYKGCCALQDWCPTLLKATNSIATHMKHVHKFKKITCKLQEFMFTTITTKHVSPMYFGISKHEK
jgi:hypothetical protein